MCLVVFGSFQTLLKFSYFKRERLTVSTTFPNHSNWKCSVRNLTESAFNAKLKSVVRFCFFSFFKVANSWLHFDVWFDNQIQLW